jgi:hypothetical protein
VFVTVTGVLLVTLMSSPTVVTVRPDTALIAASTAAFVCPNAEIEQKRARQIPASFFPQEAKRLVCRL